MSTERRRILAFTGIRSDYDLLSGVYRRLHEDPRVELALVVSGAHLAPTYGMTVREIEHDKISILARIQSLLDAHTLSARVKSGAILLSSAVDVVDGWRPDLFVYAGDREDALMAATLGAYLARPSVHFFGGDHATDGNVDNPVRHAISKLSTAHFVIHPEHARRLRALGEPDERIFVVGSPALDRFVEEPETTRAEVAAALGRPEWTEWAVLVFHPILGFEERAGEYARQILEALRDRGIRTFVSAPNSDPGNRAIVETYSAFSTDPCFAFYRNVERRLFVNLLRQARFLVGNSSLGLLEGPILKLPVVNVGARQRGRLHTGNVVFVDQSREAISNGIGRVTDPGFIDGTASVQSPFGDGRSVPRIAELLASHDFEPLLRKTEDPLALDSGHD